MTEIISRHDVSLEFHTDERKNFYSNFLKICPGCEVYTRLRQLLYTRNQMDKLKDNIKQFYKGYLGVSISFGF